MIILKENFKCHLEAFAFELFIFPVIKLYSIHVQAASFLDSIIQTGRSLQSLCLMLLSWGILWHNMFVEYVPHYVSISYT